MTSSPWASTQASATWAGSAPTRAATLRTRSASAWFAAIASASKRGRVRRKSPASRSSVDATAPVRKPRPSGEKPTTATSCSAHQGTTSASASRVHSDSSICTAAMGWTAWAVSSWARDTSLRPIARTLPAATSSASVPTDSSSGTFGSARCR